MAGINGTSGVSNLVGNTNQQNQGPGIVRGLLKSFLPGSTTYVANKENAGKTLGQINNPSNLSTSNSPRFVEPYSSVAPATGTIAQNPATQGYTMSTGPNQYGGGEKGAIQDKLNIAQKELKNLQDKQAQQEKQDKAANTYSGGINGQGQSFPGLVSQLAATAGQTTPGFNQAQATAQTAAQNLINTTPQQNAAVLAQQQKIQELQNQMALASGNIGAGTNLAEFAGQQGQLQNLYSGRLGALETGLGNILQGNAQQQAAYTGAGNLANTAGGVATGQQATQQQGLGQAAGLAQPSYVGFGQSFANPLTGQFGNVAGLQPQAQQGGVGGPQAIGNLQGQVGIGQDVATQNALLGSAQATGEALQTLITQNNINPVGFTPLNGALQLVAGYTSNEAYQKFAGQINDFVSKVAPILGGPSGATTDYKTQMAGSILNAWASGESINNVISYFLDQAKKNIQGYSAGGGAMGGGTTGGNTGGYTFDQNMFK